jgi:hypothetical protein
MDAINSHKMLMNTERRTHARHSVKGWLTLSWRDGQRNRQARALIRNISGAGVLLYSINAPPIGSFVHLRAKEFAFISGSGYVKYISRRGLIYRIGLKLSTELAKRY